MINLSTPSQELLNELWSDYKKADYWLTKKLGGIMKQKEIGDSLCYECIYQKKDLAVSEPTEYISPNGNRWLMYVVARRYDDHFYTTPMGFCYYETYGSIGAFVPTQCGEASKLNGCIIFTSHFFLRLCDRLGIKARSRAMVKRFIEYIAGMVVSYRGEGTHAKHEVDVRLPASIGRGRLRDDSPRVVEINTFLKDTELTSKQKEETKLLRESASKVDLRTSEYLKLREKSGDIKGVINHVTSNLLSIGFKKEQLDIISNIPVVAKSLCDRMNLKLDADSVRAYYENESKNRTELSERISVILDTTSTEEDINTAFWNAVYITIKKFNPNVKKEDIFEEAWIFSEEITNKENNESKI